jgi:hypothetical protein
MLCLREVSISYVTSGIYYIRDSLVVSLNLCPWLIQGIQTYLNDTVGERVGEIIQR